jgi:hypothetical protein
VTFLTPQPNVIHRCARLCTGSCRLAIGTRKTCGNGPFEDQQRRQNSFVEPHEVEWYASRNESR